MGRMRRLRLLTVAGAATMVLAGCGSGSGPASGQREVAGGDAPVTSAAHPTTTPAAPAPDPTTAAPSPARAEPEGYDPARDAAADIAAAKRAAAKDGRPVLLDFGADWCPDCVVLGKVFTRPATAELLTGYHVVRVDVGEFDHNLDLAARYIDLRTSGIPALTVLNPAGHIRVATNAGEFADARSMPESQVDAFLKKWA
ncbi:thioredoxin family protein [Streptomyces sp. NPDC004031]